MIFFIEDHTRNGLSESESEQKALAHIESILQGSSKSLALYRLPSCETFTSASSLDNFDNPFLWQEMLGSLTPDQLDVWSAVYPNLQNGTDETIPKGFFCRWPRW